MYVAMSLVLAFAITGKDNNVIARAVISSVNFLVNVFMCGLDLLN